MGASFSQACPLRSSRISSSRRPIRTELTCQFPLRLHRRRLAAAPCTAPAANQPEPSAAEPQSTPAVPPPLIGAPISPIQRLEESLLWEKLDELAAQIKDEQWITIKEAVVGAVVLASAGYVLLNGRGLLLLMSLLSARPIWKRFDPMEVLFAWEEEKKRRPPIESESEEEETLQSLVVT